MSITDQPVADAALEKEEIAALRGRLAGAVVLPGDPEYDVQRAAYNLADDSRPAIIVIARSVDDVATAVKFASARGLPVAVRNTGHGSVGCDGALLVKMHELTASSVDRVHRTAKAEAGVRWQQVIDQAAKLGLAPLNGSSTTVGVVGYHLGGGLSPIARSYGLAIDHVVSFELVDASGEIHKVTRQADPDLFWAALGTRGNFGIVTNIEFRLFPLSQLYAGGLYFAGEQAAEVLRAWRTWTEEVPEDMCSSVVLLRLPPVDELPEPLRGRFVVHVRIAYRGSSSTGEALVDRLREIGPRLLDTVGVIPYTEIGSVHADPPDPFPYYDTSALLHDLDSAAIDTVLGVAGHDAATPPTMVEIRQLGGKLDTRSPGSVVHLGGAKFSLFVATIAGPPQAEETRDVLSGLITELAPWIDGRRYPNFLSIEETGADVIAATYAPETLSRLRVLKARYDGENLFRQNHNITPA